MNCEEKRRGPNFNVDASEKLPRVLRWMRVDFVDLPHTHTLVLVHGVTPADCGAEARKEANQPVVSQVFAREDAVLPLSKIALTGELP